MSALYLLQTEKAYSQIKGGVVLVLDNPQTSLTKLQLKEILIKNDFKPKKITKVNLPSKTYIRGKKSNKVTKKRPSKFYVELLPSTKVFDENTVINF